MCTLLDVFFSLTELYGLVLGDAAPFSPRKGEGDDGDIPTDDCTTKARHHPHEDASRPRFLDGFHPGGSVP
jgi:hypothetical protein